MCIICVSVYVRIVATEKVMYLEDRGDERNEEREERM